MWIGFLAVLLAAALLIWFGWKTWQATVRRQRAAVANHSLPADDPLKGVNRYGAPYMIFGGVAAFAGGLSMLPFAIAGSLPTAFGVSALIALTVVILAAGLLGWMAGERSA
jgi:hypothetical protein